MKLEEFLNDVSETGDRDIFKGTVRCDKETALYMCRRSIGVTLYPAAFGKY
jgi:hypothetical protein